MMTVKLDINILQQHNVCRDGQVKFRRHFGRSKRWLTLEAFETDMRTHMGEWDWDEAQDKFNIGSDEYTALVTELAGPEDPDDDEEDLTDYGMTRPQARATAWARLYWAQQNPGVQSQVPAAARAYIEAVDALESTRKLKTKLTPAIKVTFDLSSYYKGDDTAFCRYMAKRAEEDLRAEVDLAIRFMERDVEAKQEALAALLHPVTVTSDAAEQVVTQIRVIPPARLTRPKSGAPQEREDAIDA